MNGDGETALKIITDALRADERARTRQRYRDFETYLYAPKPEGHDGWEIDMRLRFDARFKPHAVDGRSSAERVMATDEEIERWRREVTKPTRYRFAFLNRRAA